MKAKTVKGYREVDLIYRQEKTLKSENPTSGSGMKEGCKVFSAISR